MLTAKITLSKRLFVYVLRRFLLVFFLGFNGVLLLAQTQITPSPSYSYNTSPSGSYPDNSPVSKLTDGIKSVNVWPNTAASASLVGWNLANPSIRFIFSGGPVSISQISVWAADSDDAAGVGLPASVTISAGGTSKTISVTNPSGSGTTVSLNLTGLYLYDDTVTLVVNRNYSWTMLSEIEFYGPGGSPLSISSATEIFSDYNGNLISQEITGTGNISVLGNGVLNLGGNNSYSGGTAIPIQSYLRVSSNTALGTGSIAVNGINSGNGSTLDLNGNTISNDITTQYLNSGQTAAGLGCIQNTNTTTTAVLNGKWTLGGNNYVGGDGNLTLNGLVAGGVNNSYSIYKQGSGIWKFTNNSNTFDGFYYHIGGTTEFTSIANINEASALGKPTTSTTNQVAFGFASAGGGTLRFVGETSSTSSRTYTILGSALTTNKIEASGTSSTATLTLTGNLSPGVSGSHSFAFGGTNTGINTFSGIIGNGSGTLSLTKEGVTTWTLSGANTYTGATTVSAGVLNLQNNTGVGTTAGGVSVTSGAALELQGSVTIGAEALTINNTGISSGGVLRNISGSNTWGGTVTLGSSSRINSDAGTLTLSASTAITGTFPLTIGGDGNTTVSGAITTSTGSLTKDGNGTLTLTGSNTYTGVTNLNGGIISLGSSNALGTTGTISFGGGTLQYSSSNTTDNSSRFSNAANQSYSIHTNGQNVTLASALTSASGTMSKLGTGILTLTGANTYTGTTTISAGTLQIGSGSTTGVLGSGNVTNNAALIINRSDNLTVSNLISGTGTFTKSGSGILTLSATNTYTGATTISAGELRVNGSIATSSGVTVSSGATLSGTGTLPATTVSGTHAPGTSPGVQSVTGNLTYNAGSSINWELISNAIGTRGTHYDGIDVTGNLNFAGSTTLNLIFNGAGSSVDWTNSFWSTEKTGINGWKLFEVTGTISNLNNITVNTASQWIDFNNKVLRTQRISNGTFALEQVGTAVYLTYTPLPLSALAITGINPWVQVNTSITGIQIRAVDANGTTVADFTSTAILSGTANFTGTSASFTAGVLTTSLTPATTGSALTLIVTNSTYSISGTATFDVVSSVLTGVRVVDGTSGSTINSSYYSTTGGLTLSQGFFVDYLIVGGGGAGGSDNGGGGGGGGVLTNVGGTPITLSAQNYPITVGSGGTKGAENVRGGNGGNSSAFNLTAFGGGGGGAGASNQAPQTGGSGGGGAAEVSANMSGAAGTLGQGNSGGSARSSSDNDGGGGGGGAGSAGASGTDGGGVGGDGIANTINGVSLVYAGGGGGGPGNSTDKTAAGGNGGGGTGRRATADNGTANTGGGGGGAGATSTIVASGGNGGSGIVIVRYPGESVGSVGGTLTSFTGNGTIGESGVTYNVHTFNSSGNFNLSSLILNDRLSSTVTQSISGSGAFTYSGPGRLVLSANSTYTGNTTISAGTLQIGNGSTIGSLGTGSITNNGTLSFQRSNDYTIPGAISGTGTVEQFGAGTLNLGGLTNHQAGNWTLRSGSISNGTITSGNFSMIDGTASAVLGGTGALTKTGAGTVTLSGNNTYSGTTTVSAGTLIVNGTNSGSGAVTVASGAVLKGTGTIPGAITIQSGATLEPGNRLGTLNLGGGLTLNGGGNLNFLIDDASGAAGTDWNNLNVTDALTINATSGSKFNINVGSILANGSNGELANFSPTLNTYSWTILTATSITGFDATKFQINLDASNGMGGLISKYKVNGFSIVQDGNTLKLMYTPPAIQAIDGTNNGTEAASYTTNTSANSLTLNQGFFVDYLIVGGGGGGGGDNGGGGGAGGVLTNMGGSKLTINGGQSYPVTVGAGGSGGAVNIKGTNGGNSSVFGYTAIGGGGGGGGNSGQGPGVGGSGGGGDGESPTNGASGNLGQGYYGGSGVGNDQAGGGGGGAGSAGTNGQGADGGDGGNGVLNTISGSANYYAGGGGAGPANSSNLTSSGGSGVGGNGGPGSGSAGSANTGSGGGGAGWNGTSANGGSGGSGVVIIRYEGASLGSVGGTVTSFTGDGTNGNNGVLYQVHTFNSSSNFNLSSVSLPSRLRATLTGNVVGTGNLIYAGPGVLSLTGTGHTYTGSTSITTGELRVNSSIVTSSGLTVSSGATLSGTGTLPATTVIGTHAPGTSPGVQSVTGNLTYNAGSSINWELISNAIGTRGTDYDGINVNGNLDFTGATTLNLIFNSTGSLVDWADNFWRFSKAGTNGWKLFEVSGSVTGLNNVTVTLSSAATDKDGDLLSAQRSGLTTSFSLVQSGTGIYINYIATPVSTTWTGTTSTDWNTGSNWSSNSTPSTDNQITIANTARSPSISGTATYRSLHVNTGATFNITSGTMSIYEDVVNNGTIAGAGTLQLNGTTAQTISGTGTIGNITINNTSGGVSIASGSNKQYITGVFTPTSGVTTTNGNLVFRSTASTEGVVGTVGTCPTEPISGDVTVEKYIPAKRAFRFLTPGVTTTSTIKDNWQEGGVVSATGYPNIYPNDATANPHPGYGTHITGVGGSANGFDPTLTNNPSLFTFNPNSNLWVAATSTNAPTNVLSQGEAYRILFRGSRAVNMNDNAAAADATTLRTTGTMNFCTVRTLTTGSTIPLNPGSAGYSFIGNPYWSVLDWDAIDKTNSNITETFYYWDPTINTRGAYVSYNTSSGSSNNTSGVNRYIQPGQAFFVQNTTGVNGTSVLPSLSIDRTNIVGSPAAKPNIFSKNNITAGGELGMDDQTRVRGAVSEKIEKIQVSLIAKSRMTSGPADAFVVAYNRTFTDVMGREDAAKFTNLDENMSAFFKGTRQSILGLNQVDDSKIKSDTIPISLWNLVDGEYIINVQPNKDVNPSREIYLLNRTTKQQIRVDNISGLDHAFLMSAGVKTKDDLALVVNSRRIITAPRLRSNQLVLYPNPVTTDRVEFAVPSIDGKTTQFNSLARMELIDNTGQIILSEPVMLDAMGRGSIDLTGVASGGYIVRIYLGRQMFTSKLLKQ